MSPAPVAEKKSCDGSDLPKLCTCAMRRGIREEVTLCAALVREGNERHKVFTPLWMEAVTPGS